MLYKHNASEPIIMERPSIAAYVGPRFQKAMVRVASATDGAAPNKPAKLLGRKRSPRTAKIETANPPMKKRMTYSVTSLSHVCSFRETARDHRARRHLVHHLNFRKLHTFRSEP